MMSYVNKEEGGAAMTDFVKFQRHLNRLHRTGWNILFINTAIVSNKKAL